MKEAMRVTAKVVSVMVIILLYILLRFLISSEFISSESIVIDQYDGSVAFCSTSWDIIGQGKPMEIEANGNRYREIVITETIPTDTFIGADRIYIHRTNISDIEKGNVATIYIKYDSLVDYILANYSPSK